VPEPAPTDVVDDADAPQPVSEGTQLAEIPAVPGGNSVAAPDLAPEPQVYGEVGDDVRVMLRALQDCWVQVREESGNLILTRVLRSGDVYRVPNRENLTLLAGNAGGLEILVDGRVMPPLGPLGVVRRDISLNVDALLGATANLQ
jgi:cytoskeleton protein RodZ